MSTLDNIKFTREDATDNKLLFIDCSANKERDGSLNIEVYRKPPDQCIFLTHRRLVHKLSVIRTLQHQAKNFLPETKGKEKELKNIKAALQTWISYLGFCQISKEI